MAQYIQINQADNVAVALQPMAAGTTVPLCGGITLADDIPAGHKFSLKNLAQGENVIKYGFPIGHVTRAVGVGCHIDHNILKTNLEGVSEYTYSPKLEEIAEAAEKLTFNGFRRKSGLVGIRNQIWIIPTVGCVNGIAQKLAERFSAEVAGQMGSVDAIVAFPHNYGCSQLGCDHENTRKILRDMVQHPNAGGVLVVGLGCENNQLSAFSELVGNIDELRVKMFEAQKVDGDEVEYGLELLRSIFAVCSRDERKPVPMSELRVGLKCGGSDGLSGITANPLLGLFSDWLVAQGGTTVLTEVPEMFGAETILMNRCESREVFDKTVSLINNFKQYFIANNQPVYENPSPGNKAGGISTLEEKSLGCTQKCGKSIVRDVLAYGDRIERCGLNLLSAPGNDLVAATALAASGCQIVLFTTGRGTPFGTFVPTLKISTNTPLFAAKPNWIDFNAGVIAENESIEKVLQRFIEFVTGVLNGNQVNSEKNNYRETAIFKTGVTL
ncbi:MAG: altronate dehydratase [Salinivirgaceae bacterium]|nr:altronate dehydratase [Salinivirgaceae bacterium]